MKQSLLIALFLVFISYIRPRNCVGSMCPLEDVAIIYIHLLVAIGILLLWVFVVAILRIRKVNLEPSTVLVQKIIFFCMLLVLVFGIVLYVNNKIRYQQKQYEQLLQLNFDIYTPDSETFSEKNIIEYSVGLIEGDEETEVQEGAYLLFTSVAEHSPYDITMDIVLMQNSYSFPKKCPHKRGNKILLKQACEKIKSIDECDIYKTMEAYDVGEQTFTGYFSTVINETVISVGMSGIPPEERLELAEQIFNSLNKTTPKEFYKSVKFLPFGQKAVF